MVLSKFKLVNLTMGTIATLRFTRRAINMNTPQQHVTAVVSRQDGKILTYWEDKTKTIIKYKKLLTPVSVHIVCFKLSMPGATYMRQ